MKSEQQLKYKKRKARQGYREDYCNLVEGERRGYSKKGKRVLGPPNRTRTVPSKGFVYQNFIRFISTNSIRSSEKKRCKVTRIESRQKIEFERQSLTPLSFLMMNRRRLQTSQNLLSFPFTSTFWSHGENNYYLSVVFLDLISLNEFVVTRRTPTVI